MTINRSWLLGHVDESDAPTGMSLSRAHFQAGELPMPTPTAGEVLIRSLYFATDPLNHAWVRGVPGRFEPIPVGQPLRGGVVGEIVESRNERWQAGEFVSGFLPWSDYNLSSGIDLTLMPLQRIPQDIDPASGQGALGMTGICAYVSLTDYGQTLAGDTVVVSGASGAIGALTCQIAKLFNTRVIGLARGAEKCQFVETLGVDTAINISEPGWAQALATAAPDGVNVFVDNVGGEVLDNLLLQMVRGGRIVICGATAHYNGVANITNHMMLAINGLKMSGFFYFDIAHRWADCQQRLAQWLRDGQLRDTLDIVEGFDSVPEAALGQFQSANLGRKLIRIN